MLCSHWLQYVPLFLLLLVLGFFIGRASRSGSPRRSISPRRWRANMLHHTQESRELLEELVYLTRNPEKATPDRPGSQDFPISSSDDKKVDQEITG